MRCCHVSSIRPWNVIEGKELFDALVPHRSLNDNIDHLRPNHEPSTKGAEESQACEPLLSGDRLAANRRVNEKAKETNKGACVSKNLTSRENARRKLCV